MHDELASVSAAGHVSPGTSVALIMSWLDDQNRHVGFASFRLPAGDWLSPVKLELASAAPVGAIWVGFGLRIQNQVNGDWTELADFQLRAK
jgi:hypothetical protein